MADAIVRVTDNRAVVVISGAEALAPTLQVARSAAAAAEEARQATFDKADEFAGSIEGLQSSINVLDADVAGLDQAKADVRKVENATRGLPLIVAGEDVVLSLDEDGGLEARGLSRRLRRDAVSEVVRQVQSAGPSPLIVSGDRVPVWMTEAGSLDGLGLGPNLRRSAVSDIVTPVRDGEAFPVLVAGDRVLMWVDAGGLHVAGFKSSGLTLTDVDDHLAPALAELAPRVTAGAIPASTDGRGLRRARSRAALVRGGDLSRPLRIALTGDSWTQGVAIPRALAALLTERMGGCDQVWVHGSNTGQWGAGVSVTASAGWTWLMSDTNAAWPYGCGPDGQMGWTNRTDDTLTINTPAATELRLYTRKYGGTWRWRVDGGAWTTVSEGTGGGLTITVIGGLSDAAHVLEIDTTGNAGVLAWCGLGSRRTGAKAEVIKLGKGGQTGHDMRGYVSGVGDIWDDIDPDLVVLILGTNDYVLSESPPTEFKAAITETVTMLRASVGPDVGIVLVAPALSSTAPVTPLSAYRDAMYDLAISLGVEFLNGYDLISPNAEDPVIWADTRHLNQRGGDVLCALLNNRLMGF